MSNPALLHLPLRSGLDGRDRNGIVSATASGPVRFTADGYYAEEGTSNLIPNPSFEVDTAGWQGSNATISRVTTDAKSGSAACRVVTINAAPGEGLLFSGTTLLAAVAGQTWTLTAWVKGSGVITPRISERNNLGNDLGSFNEASVTLTNDWQRISYTRTLAQTGCTYIRPSFVTDPLGSAQNVTFFVDSIQLEQKAYATSYCDGSLGTGYSWAGTAHASASSRAESHIQIATAGHFASTRGALALRGSVPAQGARYLFNAGVGVNTGASRIALRSPFTANGKLLGYFFDSSVATNLTSVAPTASGDTAVAYLGWDGADVSMSVDQEDLLTGTRNSSGGDLEGQPIVIGAVGSSNHMNGYVSDLLIFDRPLTDAERAYLAATPEWSFGVLANRIIPGLLLPV